MAYRIDRESVKVQGSGELCRLKPFTIPIPPTPGLVIGALTVERVLVNQGAPIDDGIDIEYVAVDKTHARILVQIHGWEECE